MQNIVHGDIKPQNLLVRTVWGRRGRNTPILGWCHKSVARIYLGGLGSALLYFVGYFTVAFIGSSAKTNEFPFLEAPFSMPRSSHVSLVLRPG